MTRPIQRMAVLVLAALPALSCSEDGPSGPGPGGDSTRIAGRITATEAAASTGLAAHALGLSQGSDFVGDEALANVTIEIVDGGGSVVASTETDDDGLFSAAIGLGMYTVHVLLDGASTLAFMLDVPEGGTLFAEGRVDLLPNGKLKLDVQIFRDNDGDGAPDDSFRIVILGRVEGDLTSGDLDVVASQDDVEDLVTICHIPPGNPNAAHTIVVGAPAVAAHLSHGDFEGECDGDDGASDGDLDNDGVDDDLGQPRVLVCHIPPGDPENPVSIEIAEPAVAAHLGHGDTLGLCPGDTGPVGDDENEENG